ncbi:MAG: sulfotransferase [Methanolobus sp.]
MNNEEKIMLYRNIKKIVDLNYNFVKHKADYVSNLNSYKFSSIHETDSFTIKEMYDTFEPVFVLSTGRTGTKFSSLLLNKSKLVDSYHEPEPSLQHFCDFAYHNQKQSLTLNKMFDAARMELILNTYIKNKIYVETNQCMAFYAPEISKLFKRSKFVHLKRHPGDFTRSAIRKGWYKSDSIWESGRIKMNDEKHWSNMGQVEKLGWLWTATNEFIEDFQKTIAPSRMVSIKMEEMTTDPEKVLELFNFVGVHDVSKDGILKMQKKKVNEPVVRIKESPNIKKVKDFPKYNDWDLTMKEQFKLYTKDLAERYGYAL